MKTASYLILLGLLILTATPAGAGMLPEDGDSWSEYASAAEAEADGWTRQCGLSQQIIVSDDCSAGTGSVGCGATRAYWCDTFSYNKTLSLEHLTDLDFWFRATWSGSYWSVYLYMEATEAELAEGIDQKRIGWGFDNSTDWTHFSASVDEGQWMWRHDGVSWNYEGGNTELTELISITWSYCSYWGIAIGDEMLIDGLCLQFEDTGLIDPTPAPLALHQNYPNPFNPKTAIRFDLAAEGLVSLKVFAVDGRQVATLADGILPAGRHELSWDGQDDAGRSLASGAYLYRLVAAGRLETRRMLLLK